MFARPFCSNIHPTTIRHAIATDDDPGEQLVGWLDGGQRPREALGTFSAPPIEAVITSALLSCAIRD